MPSLEIPSFIFIYRVERCQVTLDLLLILLFLFLLSNNEIFSFFLFFFLVDPPRVCRETEGDIQRNTRFCTSTKKVFFILLSPRYLRKTCAQTFAGGKKSCFVDASPFIRATTFNRDTRPFLLRLFRGKRKIAET